MFFSSVYTKDDSMTFDKGLRDYLVLVYKNMGLALIVSALVSFIIGNSPMLLKMLFGNPIISLILVFSPLIVSIYFSSTLWSSSMEKSRNLFFTFAVLMGASLSTIFIVYTRTSIFQTFLTTAGTFGVMSLYGYRTKKDLSSLNSFLMMGLIGILIASLLNIFFKSPAGAFLISVAGVIIFTLFTAYDVQKIKKTYEYVGVNSDMANKVALIGALNLYLDFVNLFTYLLRFMGNTSNRD